MFSFIIPCLINKEYNCMEDLDDTSIKLELQNSLKDTKNVSNLGIHFAAIFKLPLRLDSWSKDDIGNLRIYKFEYTDTGVNGEGSNAKFVGSITFYNDEILAYSRPVIKDDEI